MDCQLGRENQQDFASGQNARPEWTSFEGRPRVALKLIDAGLTSTGTGVMVYCELDGNQYEMSRKVNDAQMEALNIQRYGFHGEWKYTFVPRPPDEAVNS